MATFKDLKVGDYFYYVSDIEITVYKIKEITDQGSYLLFQGVSDDPEIPDRGFSILKEKLGTYMKHSGCTEEYVDAYISDWREAKNVLSEIAAYYQAIANDAQYNLEQFLKTTGG